MASTLTTNAVLGFDPARHALQTRDEADETWRFMAPLAYVGTYRVVRFGCVRDAWAVVEDFTRRRNMMGAFGNVQEILRYFLHLIDRLAVKASVVRTETSSSQGLTPASDSSRTWSSLRPQQFVERPAIWRPTSSPWWEMASWIVCKNDVTSQAVGVGSGEILDIFSKSVC